MKRNLSGDISTCFLSPTLRPRFLYLYAVASRKSVFTWREAELSRAEVLVLDISSVHVNLPHWPPCAIWLGEQPSEASHSFHWNKVLPLDYTVADLMDMLDRAAVFLMDWKVNQSTQPSSPKGVLLPEVERIAGACYRLVNWVTLSAPLNRPEYLRAMALMAREAVTLSQLEDHAALSKAQVNALLDELHKREVLRVSKAIAKPVSTTQSVLGSSANYGQRRLIQRLSSWLVGAVRA